MSGKAEQVFENVTQIRDYLIGCGYKATHYRVQKAVERNELILRRGGGWTQRTVDAWALKWLAAKIDHAADQDRPAAPVAEVGSVSEQKNLAHTKNLLLDAERKEFEFAKERGQYTSTEIVNAELSARARAFRVGLERFGFEQAEAVAGDFGGHARAAKELARRLGLEGESAEKAQLLIQDFALSRAQLFTSHWLERIDLLLDPYATGHWWTTEMREAWEKYEAGHAGN